MNPLPRNARSVAMAVAVLLALTGCGGGSDGKGGKNRSAPATAKSVTVAVSADEGTLTPYTNKTGYPGTNLVRLVFDTLVVLDPRNEVKPLLARELRTTDHKVYTMPLRSGLTWHDGRPFTADDVVFSVRYYQKHVGGDQAVDVRGIRSVAAGSDTVTITLDRPDPEFPIRTLADMSILPRHLWESETKPQRAGLGRAIGTGPYKLIKYDKDRGYTLQANPSYALGKPRVGAIQVTVIPQEQTQYAALRTGEVQLAGARPVPPQQVEQLKRQPQITVAEGVDFPPTLLLFNNGRKPFDRPEVRRALAKAVNVDELVKTVMLGRAAPGHPGFMNPEAPIRTGRTAPVYDLAAAKRELDAVGAKPGDDGIRVLDGRPMRFELLAYSTSPDRVRSAELIRGMLQQVGVQVTVRVLAAEAMDAKVWPDFDVTKGRNYDMAMWGWSAPVMIDTTKIASLVAADPAIGRLNVVGLRDTRVDAVVTRLLATATPADRAREATRLQAAIAEAMPFVTLYYRNGAYAYRNDTYGGWVWQKGAGILQKFSFVDYKLG